MAEPAYALPRPADPDAHAWPEQGSWTWDDYLRLPEDGNRYEILRGVLYVTPAPIYDHQFTVYELAGQLRNFVLEHRLGQILGAPFDVKLPGIASPIQPDVLFFRNENRPRAGDKLFEGVPDLVVEVLSPGTSRLDQHVKFGAYEDSGVDEYWVADPKARTVTVYRLQGENGEYAELGRYGVGETLRSGLLKGFETDVVSLFPPSPDIA